MGHPGYSRRLTSARRCTAAPPREGRQPEACKILFGVQPIEEFVDLVVPELQRRGRYQRDYAGTTQRDHLMQER
jgi:hypothetical protein